MDSAWVAAVFGLIGSVVGVAGGVVTTLLTLNRQDVRTDYDWARQQRREIYAGYSGVLNAVHYVVTYDDQLNLRMGNEATQAMDAADAIFDLDPAFDLFASTQMRYVHTQLSRAYDTWQKADEMERPLTEQEREADDDHEIPVGAHMVKVEKNYFARHQQVDDAGKAVDKVVDEAFRTMREELGTVV